MSGIASYLKTLREKSGLSVAQAAEKSDISAPYLYQLECGRRTPSAKVLSRLSSTYRVRVEDLLVQANLLPPAVITEWPSEDREQRIDRAFEFVTRDPGVRAGSDAMRRLPHDAKLAIIRLYERAEGLRILPEDFA